MSDVVWLSREQGTEAEFGTAMTQLRSYFGQPEGRAGIDALTEVMLHFGACERGIRRAERLRALGHSPAEVQELEQRALQDNERGLAALPGVRPFIDYLANQQPTPMRWRADTSHHRRCALSCATASPGPTDLGAGDAQHLTRVMDERCDTVDEAGAPGLGRHSGHSRASTMTVGAAQADDRVRFRTLRRAGEPITRRCLDLRDRTDQGRGATWFVWQQCAQVGGRDDSATASTRSDNEEAHP